MTADIDLYVDLEKVNASRFLAAMKALGFVPGVPVPAESFADPEARDTWRREKNMLVMGFVNPSRPVIGLDVFVFEPVPFGPAYERRKRVSVENEALEIPVASREDLIAMKEGTQIRRWETVPVMERLRWLEEANEFLYQAQDAETRARWQAIRRGER
jgi:hypothetical protein